MLLFFFKLWFSPQHHLGWGSSPVPMNLIRTAFLGMETPKPLVKVTSGVPGLAKCHLRVFPKSQKKFLELWIRKKTFFFCPHSHADDITKAEEQYPVRAWPPGTWLEELLPQTQSSETQSLSPLSWWVVLGCTKLLGKQTPPPHPKMPFYGVCFLLPFTPSLDSLDIMFCS